MLRKYLWLICLLLLPATANATVGTCGPSQGSTVSQAPTGLCNSGSASALIGSGPWSWICQGDNGDTTQLCTAYTTGHLFDNWTGPNGFFSATTPLTVDANTDASLIVAHFKLASYPISRHGLADVLQFAGGASHTVVLKKDHTVVAWGGSQNQSVLPAGLKAKAIGAGTYHTLAIADDGHVVAAGAYIHPVNNEDPQKAPLTVFVPDALTRAGAGVAAVSGGYSHSLALMDDGTLAAWGDNTYGQSTIPFDPPTSTIPLAGVVAIASGHHHNLALKNDGTVVAWGRYFEGQTTLPNFGGAKVVAISAKAYNSMALTETGKVFVWGANESGQLGDPIGSPSQAQSGIKAIAAGGHHMVALKNDGTVLTWGHKEFGQLDVPIGLNGITSIAAGTYFTLALKGDLALVGWGLNQSHQCDVPGDVYLFNGLGPAAHGTISCVLAAPLYGTNSTCTIDPDQGYGISNFLVNGIPRSVTPGVTPGTYTYTINNVTGYQSITATFAQGAEVTSFVVPPLVNTLAIPIDSFTATGQGAITGYLITESPVKPGLTAVWKTSAPTTYTVTTAGTKTLYAWAKDAAGNISDYKSATVNVDTTPPAVTFSIGKNPSNLLNVPITLTALDQGDVKVTGYAVKESSIAPTANEWSASAPTSHTFAGTGLKTLYAWAKDEAGNVSAAKSATVTIDTTLPTISLFTVKSPSGVDLQITGFTATDNLGIAGYLVTTSSDIPADAVWSSIKPSTVKIGVDGPVTLYAWVKDTAGNVSASKSATATVDSQIPVVDVFDVPAVVKGLSVPINAFHANDQNLAGYLITLSGDPKPASSLLTWKATPPTSFAVTSSGVKTLYAWAKDAVGNVSSAKTAVVNFDTLAPVVTLTAPAQYNLTTVPISFSAADAGKITGYIVKDNSTAPLLNSPDWLPAPATSFTFSGAGTKMLSAWAKDEAGNISAVKTATVVIDTIAPTLTGFAVKSPSNSKKVTITVFTGTDNVGVGSYLVTETPAIPPNAVWSAVKPLTYTVNAVDAEGNATLFGWVRDKAGNISASKSATVNIDDTAPTVTNFKAPATLKTLTIPIDAFDAQDNKGVTGYMITTTNVKPLATLTTWKATRPTSFAVTTAGVKTLYAWAKDLLGNVSDVTATSTIVVNVDMTPPAVTFTVPTPQNSTTVNFTLSTLDAGIIAGYVVKETSTAPVAGDWVATKPASYTFNSTGTKTLYAWAKDEMGNVSVVKSATVVIDTTVPTVTGFAVKSPYNSKTVPITVFTGTDNIAVAGYLVTESADVPPNAVWSLTRPLNYTVNTVDIEGNATLYGWVRDKAGNISASKSATVTIDDIAPIVESFEPKLLGNSLTVPINNFTASDNKSVAGYLITTSNIAPAATLTTWKATAPTTFLVSSTGSKILYAWAKDWVGKVSASKSVTINVDMTKPIITTFTVTTPVSSLTVPITAFVPATDASGIAGYMVTESSIAPAASAAGWLPAKPDSYTASGAGSKILYAWVKDGAGNVSYAKTAMVTIKLP